MTEQSQIIIPDFAPTQEQIDFRKAIAHRVHPIVVDDIISNLGETTEVTPEVTRAAARVTLAFVDALIEELDK